MKSLLILIISLSVGGVFFIDKTPEKVYTQEITHFEELEYFGEVLGSTVNEIKVFKQGDTHFYELGTEEGTSIIPINKGVLNADGQIPPCGCRWFDRSRKSPQDICDIPCS